MAGIPCRRRSRRTTSGTWRWAARIYAGGTRPDAALHGHNGAADDPRDRTSLPMETPSIGISPGEEAIKYISNTGYRPAAGTP